MRVWLVGLGLVLIFDMDELQPEACGEWCTSGVVDVRVLSSNRRVIEALAQDQN